MKKRVTLVLLALLAGCATGPEGLSVTDLREPMYLRDERRLPLTFPKIQMALFQHNATCGTGLQLVLDSDNPSYAAMAWTPALDTPADRPVTMDLTQMASGTVVVQAYSYYADSNQKIQQAFDAILHPEVCPG